MATLVRDENAPTAKEVFVISPIGEAGTEPRKDADRFLDNIVRRALPEPDYIVRRADEDDSSYAITEAMLRRILDADLCVADITGLNPNVMYELALAHAAGKKVVTMTRDKGRPPFDIKDVRVITYGFMWEEVEAAVSQLTKKAEHEPENQRFKDMFNPVATAFAELMDREKAESEQGTPVAAVARLVETLERKVDQVIRSESRDASGFGHPTIIQTEPGVTILQRANKVMGLFSVRALEPNVGPQTLEKYRGHLNFGQELIREVTQGKGDLARLDQWSDEMERYMLIKDDLDAKHAQLP